MSLPYNKKLIPIAKELRKSMTKQELFLWSYFLKDYPIRFQRQKVIDNFIVDFYCHKAFLVIEIDGSQHYSENGLAYDDHRTDILSKYNLLRVSIDDLSSKSCFSNQTCGDDL